ncbi:putative Pentatricopeptide repeat superfamily protein [Hibiscus syriacus]|uniref:Pentatricopeptide repeat superfamily protein n=1 Tax=Hibiscus syriacus TaxID=106335 RepID=A0A6A2XXD3_HIBSY|nr:putative Pentatricopeptide repeat superfamily protein [Hibiscus syriacus]
MGLSSENKIMEELSAVVTKFGDDQSSLLDRFERSSFEAQLKDAILGRSLSESSVVNRSRCLQLLAARPQAMPQVSKGRGLYGFSWFLKKLLKPIIGSRGNAGKNHLADAKNPITCSTFSRSLRF